MSHLLRRLKVLTGVVLGDAEARHKFCQVWGRLRAKIYRRYFYFIGRLINATKRIPARTHSKRVLRIASMAGEDDTRMNQWRLSIAQYFHASASNHHRRVFLDEIQSQSLTPKSNDYENAAFNYRVAIELTESPADSHYNLGRVLLSQNKLIEAYFHFEEVISLLGLVDKHDQDERHLQANAYWSQAETFNVRDFCIAAIERFKHATVHLDRFGAGQRLYADQLRQSGQFEEAANGYDFITTYAHRPMAEFIPVTNQADWLALIDQHGIFALNLGIIESSQHRAFFHSGIVFETDGDQMVPVDGAELIRAYFDAPNAWKVSLPQDAATMSGVCQTVTDVKS